MAASRGAAEGPVHVIANAAARRAGRLPRLLAALTRRGVEAVVHRPVNSDVARATAAGCASLGPAATVVAAGGDGTLNAVVNGLLSGGASNQLPAVAVWPLGTANVTAREIGAHGLADDTLAAWIVDGARTPIAVGHLAGATPVWLVQMASVGFDAMVVATVPSPWKRAVGGGAYVLRSLTALARYRATPLRVTVDGMAHTAMQAIAANGRLYGGPFVAAPNAELAAPTFAVCLAARGGRAQVVAAATRLLLGRFANGVSIVSGARVSIASAGAPVAVQVDGEPAGTTPVDLTAGAATLALVTAPAPAGARGSAA